MSTHTTFNHSPEIKPTDEREESGAQQDLAHTDAKPGGDGSQASGSAEEGSSDEEAQQVIQERQDAIDRICGLVRRVPVAMLTTVGSDGVVHARPMVNVNDRFNGDLWFFTKYDDGKVNEIASHAQVNVAFSDPSKQQYVSMTGRAEVLRDPKRSELLWKSDCEPWFPEGLDDPNLGLIRVDVESAEYWDQRQGAMVALADYVKSWFTGDSDAKVQQGHVEWPSAGKAE